MKVMIVVTHLLGTGHLARALTLGRAFASADHTVQIVSGGMPAPHLTTTDVPLVQLPPLRSDGVDFTRLLDDGGKLATDTYRANRVEMLLNAFSVFQPDVLLTELFPFGRRVLKEEFLTLLSAAKSRPVPPIVCASIRDILAPPSKPSKAEFAERTVLDSYDAVLVHSDPDLTPLSLSWPVTPRLESKLRFTGFVAPAPPPLPEDVVGKGEIIVSVGGGDVGDNLIDAALQAASFDKNRGWRVLIGGSNAPDRCLSYASNASENMIVEPARPDFRQLLHHAAASVSLCGYNTALDILQTRCAAVFVPFDAGGEVEQTLRATALAKQPGIEMLRSAELKADTLLALISSAITDAPKRPAAAQMEGAATTVQIVEAMLQAKRHD